METLETIKKRRSVREFRPEPIPKETIERLVDAARFAATARNLQPWEFIAVTRKDTLKKIAELVENGRFIADAALCIAVYCRQTKYYLEDGCAATENILLAATEMGIASCWVAGDKKQYCNAVSALLGVPAEFNLVSLIALGYPVSPHAFKTAQKRSCREILHWEKF
ncbi:MAG: nitroreductase family protein [Candidatus Omnitrophica bacterium]|nr:nitroreductase family protein [Candidatus Omnitrophota bacterium]